MTKSAEEFVASDIVVLGKIAGAYGIRGALKVFPFADDPARWARLAGWWVGHENAPPDQWQYTKLDKCKVQDTFLVTSFEQVTDRTTAEHMVGMLVGVPKEMLPETEKDEYYWADLIGLEVFNTKDESLGFVLGLIETSANDVLRVGQKDAKLEAGDKQQERLLPFVGSVVLDVDIEKQRMTVLWELDW